jgi:sulfur carrier protein
VNVVVNGAPMNVASEYTVSDLLDELGRAHGRGVAVAINGEVVGRSQWRSAQLKPDDRVEVLGAIGGG